MEWHGRYPFFRYLQQSGILPGFDHQIQDIIKALNIGLGGKSPALTCRKYSDFTNPILSQIKLCFDKSMTLVDCYSVMPWNKVLDSCPNEGLVFYPRYEHNNKKVENAGETIIDRFDQANSLADTNLFRCNHWACDWSLCIELVSIYDNKKVRSIADIAQSLERHWIGSGYTLATWNRKRSSAQYDPRSGRNRYL